MKAHRSSCYSIYGWRGAKPGLIADFRRHYRPTVIELERHYRSSSIILFAAEHLIRHNLPAAAHQLMASEGGSDAEAPIYHYLFATGQQEQAWVTQLVRKLVAERGYRYSDIAVLYRTHQLADPLEGSLLQAGIPVERVRRESFFQEPAMRETIRYVYLLHALAHSAESTSPGAFLGAFNFPQTLAGELTVLQLDRLAATHRLPLAELARRSAHFPELSPLTRTQLQDFISLLDEQVVAGADEDAASGISSVFNVLARRRSPFTAEERAMLHDAAAFLSYPEAVAALKDGLGAQGNPRLPSSERSDRGSPAATARAAGRQDGDGHVWTEER
jgi:DNA helicase-2/ATP-dependent DNA helicase PcrA